MEKKQLTYGKKIVFILLQLSFTILFILFIELALRLFHVGKDLSLFQKSPQYTGYYEINPSVGKRFFNKLQATSSINDLFLIEKPDSCYRVFILGGSTAQGFPYQSGVSFGRILNYRLQDAFPNKLIEVVNLSMSATNSYTQADFIDEVLKYKPDAILIYAGHNEYYGALGVGSIENGGNVPWLKKLNLKLVHLRTYQLLQQIIAKSFKSLSRDITDNPTATLMEQIANDKAIGFDSELFRKGVEQFRMNMNEILDKANKKKIPVLIGEVVSNVRDIKPFKSMVTENYPLADSIYKLALHYDISGSYQQARELYYKAKDLDGIRFRAPEAINEVIHELGKKHKVPVVPVKSVFEAYSPNGIIGNNLMLEHLHPNVDGYFLLAEAYFNAMKENGFIQKTWNKDLCNPMSYYRSNWGFTALDSLAADLLIKKLLAGWPFQPDTVVNQFRFTYHPVSYIDSMAFMCIKYNNVSVTGQHIALAKKYETEGRFNDAFKEYFALIKSEPHKSSYYYDAADLLLKSNEPLRAASVLESMPNYITDYNGLIKNSQCYRIMERWDKAIVLLEKAVNVCKPTDNKETALVLLYDTYLKASQKENARKILTELIKINPKHKDLDNEQNVKVVMTSQKIKPLLDSAVVFARAGRLTEATALLNKSLKIEETSFACSMLGSIYFQTDKAMALKYYEKAYLLDSKDANVLNNLCVLSIMKSDFNSANKYLNELKEHSTNIEQVNNLTSLLKKSQSKVK